MPQSERHGSLGDEALVRRLAAGDADALDPWYRGEHPRVFRLCLGFLADSGEAEDLAQDAMLHILDRLDRWDPQRPYASWRNAVVLNLCRDRRRKLAARRNAEGALSTRRAPLRALPRPEEAAERAEVRAMLTEALAALPDREREVFVLRDMEGIATRDAAAAMQVGESTVRSLLTLARRRLRNLLGPALAIGSDLDSRSRGAHRA